jgi:drug/metabolite transporter (DMT)-like permease
MNNPDFHLAIQRIRRLHWLHFPAQALLMAAVVLAAGRQLSPAGPEPRLATWPALLGLGVLLPLVGALLYGTARRLRPNLRRLAEENLRIYKSRLILRNSLLNLLSLPLLISYSLTRTWWPLMGAVLMVLVLCLTTAPSAKKYQRWLLR